MKIMVEPSAPDAVTIAVSGEGGEVTGTLDAAAIDALMHRLVEARQRIQPVHAASPGAAGDVPYPGDNMLWQVRPAPTRRGVELAVQNPGLGWVSLALSRAQVEDLITSFEFALLEMPQVPPLVRGDEGEAPSVAAAAE